MGACTPLLAMDQEDFLRDPAGQVVTTQGRRLLSEFQGTAEPTQLISTVRALIRPLARSASFEMF